MKGLEIKNTSKFNFKGFAKWLAREGKIIECSYYIGVVRAKEGDEKGQQMRRAQQKLFSFLESPEQDFKIYRGFLMNNEGVYHEKGVDVKIAVDLVKGSYEDYFDTAIVVSSDTDLIPAFKVVKEQKKSVEYIGFSHIPSFGLQKHATLSRLLIKEDIEQFEFTSLI